MTTTKNFFRASAEDFKKIPGSPVAYWVSRRFVDSFKRFPLLGSFMTTREGMTTSNNDLFMRFWPEVSIAKIAFGTRPGEGFSSKWCPYEKGGEFRRWYGNRYFVVNWEEDGRAIRSSIDVNTGRVRSHNYNGEYAYRSGVTWSEISSGTYSARYAAEGCLFDSKGAKGFSKDEYVYLALLNTSIAARYLKFISPTLDYKPGHIVKIPVAIGFDEKHAETCSCCLVNLSRADWDVFETSWDFTVNPLVAEWGNPVPVERDGAIGDRDLLELYAVVREKWAKDCEEMRRLEMENNRIFIEAYGLQDELTPEVPWQEITLTCNPFYRYGVKEPENAGGGGDGAAGVCALPRVAELEERLKGDTVKELVSYAVGCMMGRYSLAKPGLILADQGATLADYEAKVATSGRAHAVCAFSPDDDGIIPVLDDDCFADDIVTQFEKFLVAAFGAAQLGANRAFIEQALGKDLRSYFVKDFYADHLQRYQKRPIYWLFSSPKGTFNALVYLHRYQPNTAGQVLGYLRSFITKLQAKIEAADKTAADPNASQSFRTRAIKERTKLARQLKELEDYERDVLHPLSLQHVALDLDDGVKVNYLKLGAALKKIPGLEAKE